MHLRQPCGRVETSLIGADGAGASGLGGNQYAGGIFLPSDGNASQAIKAIPELSDWLADRLYEGR